MSSEEVPRPRGSRATEQDGEYAFDTGAGAEAWSYCAQRLRRLAETNQVEACTWRKRIRACDLKRQRVLPNIEFRNAPFASLCIALHLPRWFRASYAWSVVFDDLSLLQLALLTKSDGVLVALSRHVHESQLESTPVTCTPIHRTSRQPTTPVMRRTVDSDVWADLFRNAYSGIGMSFDSDQSSTVNDLSVRMAQVMTGDTKEEYSDEDGVGYDEDEDDMRDRDWRVVSPDLTKMLEDEFGDRPLSEYHSKWFNIHRH